MDINSHSDQQRFFDPLKLQLHLLDLGRWSLDKLEIKNFFQKQLKSIFQRIAKTTATQLIEATLDTCQRKWQALEFEDPIKFRSKSRYELQISPQRDGEIILKANRRQKTLTRLIQEWDVLLLNQFLPEFRISSEPGEEPWCELILYILEKMSLDYELLELANLSYSEFAPIFYQYAKQQEMEILLQKWLDSKIKYLINGVILTFNLSNCSLEQLQGILGFHNQTVQKHFQKEQELAEQKESCLKTTLFLFLNLYELIKLSSSFINLKITILIFEVLTSHIQLIYSQSKFIYRGLVKQDSKTRIKRILLLTEPSIFSQDNAREPMVAGSLISSTLLVLLQPKVYHEEELCHFSLKTKLEKYKELNYSFIVPSTKRSLLAYMNLKELLEASDSEWVYLAKIHLIFAAYAARQTEGQDFPLVLKGTDLLNLIGGERRKDKTLSEKLQELKSWIESLSFLHFSLTEPDSSKTSTRSYEPIWKVSLEVEEQQQEFEEEPNLEEVVIQFQPGEWIKRLPKRVVSGKGKHLCHLGYLSKSTLQVHLEAKEKLKVNLSPTGLAPRIALYIASISSLHRVSQKSREYKVKNFLRMIGVAADSLDEHKWNQTIEVLQELGWPIQYVRTDCQNSSEIVTTFQTAEVEESSWLETKVKINPPCLDDSDKKRIQQRHRDTQAIPPLTGKQILALVRANGIELKTLGLRMGWDDETLEAVENGYYYLSHSELSRLWHWERLRNKVLPPDVSDEEQTAIETNSKPN